MFASMPTPHSDHGVLAVADLALHVRRGERIPAGREGVLGVVQHPYVVPERGDGVDVGRHRTVALTGDGLRLDRRLTTRAVSVSRPPAMVEESTLTSCSGRSRLAGTRAGRSPTAGRR